MSSDYEYVDERSIDDDLKCSICGEPFIEPVSTPCDHTFCRSCIKQWLKKKSSCPTCRQKSLSAQHLSPITVRIVLNMLDRLSVSCKACGQVGLQRGNYNDHLCPKSIVGCSAFDIGCLWQGRREELVDKHNRNTCPYEQIRDILEKLYDANEHYSERCHELQKEIEEMQANKIQLTNRCNEQKTEIDELRTELGKQQDENEFSSTACSLLERTIIGSTTVQRTVTFDALVDSIDSNRARMGIISDGFAGLSWTNAMYMTKYWATAHLSPKSPIVKMFSNHSNNMTATCIAYNASLTKPLYVRALQAGDTFSLMSLELVSFYTINIAIFARRHNTRVFDKTIKLNGRTMAVSMSTWNDIDELEFRPIGIVTLLGSFLNFKPLFALTKMQLI